MPPHQRHQPAPTTAASASARVLVRRSRALRGLYVHAADVSEPGLRLVLSDNVKTLDLVIGDLQTQFEVAKLQLSTRASWPRSTPQRLARWWRHATPRSGAGWIRLLGHRERALLRAFELAIVEATPDARLTLRRQLPRLQGIDLDMGILSGIARH